MTILPIAQIIVLPLLGRLGPASADEKSDDDGEIRCKVAPAQGAGWFVPRDAILLRRRRDAVFHGGSEVHKICSGFAGTFQRGRVCSSNLI